MSGIGFNCFGVCLSHSQPAIGVDHGFVCSENENQPAVREMKDFANPIRCTREEGVTNEVVDLFLSPDNSNIIKVGSPMMAGIGL